MINRKLHKRAKLLRRGGSSSCINTSLIQTVALYGRAHNSLLKQADWPKAPFRKRLFASSRASKYDFLWICHLQAQYEHFLFNISLFSFSLVNFFFIFANRISYFLEMCLWELLFWKTYRKCWNYNECCRYDVTMTENRLFLCLF